MSTLKTHNLQSPDAGSVNIAMTPNAGMVVAGLSTYSNQINVGSNIKLGTAGVATATNFKTGSSNLHSTGLTVGNALVHSTGINVGTGATIHVPSSNVLTLGTNSNERLRIDSSGRVLLGHTASVPTGGSATAHFKLQVQGINFEASGIFQQRYQNGTAGASLYLGHSRGAIGVQTALQQDDEVGKIAFVASDGTDFAGQAGRIQCLMAANATSDNTPGHLTFNTCPSGSNSTIERLRIDSAGRCIVGGGTHAGGSALVVKGGNQNTYSTIGMFSNHTNPAADTLLSQIRFGSNGTAVGADIRVYADAAWGTNDYPTRIQFYTTPDGSNSRSERLRITSAGNIVTYNNHLSGTSGHQLTSWYGDDANHYTLEHKDFNEIRAIKTLNSDTYGSIVYKREMMTEYCDIEFTLKGNAPSGTNRHTMFVINGDGSDTLSNYDRLVFRYRPGDTNGNQIRIDKGGGGYGFTEENSSVPNFFDGNERHVHIQIRKRTFSITVNRVGHAEYNLSKRTNADLVSSRGYFGFSLYERASHGTPELTIRDFKITNYTQNAIPAQSVAFQAFIPTGNPSKSGGYTTKPASQESFDNGYGGNYNTSNYRFTAPVAGVYMFSQTFNVYSSPNGMFCSIRLNGSQQYIGTKRNDNAGSGDQNTTATVILQLEEGDYVDARDYSSSSVTYSSSVAWNRFEGSLIAAFK